MSSNYAKKNYPMDKCAPKTVPNTGYKKPSYANNQGALGHRHTAATKAPKNYKG